MTEPPGPSPDRRYSLYDYTINDWTSILELAQKWEFREVKQLAIRELEMQEIPIIERIALYQKYDVDTERLVRYYAELCQSPHAPTDEDSEAIGLKTTVLIFRARERLRAQLSDKGLSPLPVGVDIEDVRRIIANLVAPVIPANKVNEGRKSDQGPLTLYSDILTGDEMFSDAFPV